MTKVVAEFLLGCYWIFVVVFAYRRGSRDGRRFGYGEGWRDGQSDAGVVKGFRIR